MKYFVDNGFRLFEIRLSSFLDQKTKGLSIIKTKSLSAGRRGSLSKSKGIENKVLTPNVFSQTDLTRLTEELIKFHEFYKIHFREITAILEKD